MLFHFTYIDVLANKINAKNSKINRDTPKMKYLVFSVEDLNFGCMITKRVDMPVNNNSLAKRLSNADVLITMDII